MKIDLPMPARIVLALAVLISLLTAQTSQIENRPPESSWSRDLPRGFAIHGQKWLLLQVKSIENGYIGMTYCATHTVEIRSDIAKPFDVADTVWHEVMHALVCDGGEAHDERWNNSNDEADGCQGHCGIEHMSGEVVSFMADNPDLVKFIEENGKK